MRVGHAVLSKIVGGAQMLPYFTDTSFMYVNTAETRHWGGSKEFFVDPYGQVGSQSDVAAMEEHEFGLHSVDDVRATQGRNRRKKIPTFAQS